MGQARGVSSQRWKEPVASLRTGSEPERMAAMRRFIVVRVSLVCGLWDGSIVHPEVVHSVTRRHTAGAEEGAEKVARAPDGMVFGEEEKQVLGRGCGTA